MEYVADNAALEKLKKQYGDPVALISGDYESKNGTEFTFTGGAAMLSPSVTATWNKSSGKLVIKKDGTIEHSGVSLNAPSFKFYQPKNGAEKDLQISLTKDGFAFQIDPEKNDAIVFVDIPYAAVKLENAKADAAGNLVFSGDIGFRTIFNGAEFSMEKLGYGLNTKNEFKVNGVKATGSFDTAKLMALELASISGEVNTFKGEERYAFELELNAFDLFETEASLALERSKKDGSLIPDELWFFVKSSPGIPLVPPVPVGQLNGGGAGFKDLAKTVNGDYFAIPPIKLRGALAGTYMHLIEGTGNVVLGPSEISLKATDVGIVGLGKNAQFIDSFGYSLQLNGQERTYKGVTYKGTYFGGSEELAINLPSKTLDIFYINTAIKLGAFGGANQNKDTVYLGIGANGIVKGRLQIPSSLGIPFLSGLTLMLRVNGVKGKDVTGVFLLVSRDTTAPVLTLSAPIFYADRAAGSYQITGTADAGSEVLYGENNESVYAAGDGSFAIQGTLEERQDGDALYIRAQDSAGNLSARQLALVARQAETYAVTVTTNGNGTASADLAAAAAGTNISLSATPNTGYHFKEWQVVSGGVTIENDKFTMPDGNVEIKAIFEKDAAPVTPAPTATPKPESSPTPAPAATAKPNGSPTPAPAATAKPNSSTPPAPAAVAKPDSSTPPAPVAAAKPNSSPTPAPAATAKPESSPALAPTATAKPDSSPTPALTAPATKLPVWWVALPIVGGVALAGVFVMRKKKRRR